MRLIHLVAAISFPLAAVAQEQPTTYEGVKALAMKGDYQAQRNLAYGYAAYPYKGQERNPLLACAWYLVVLHSGSQKLGEGDVGNMNVYCNKLNEASRTAANGQARAIFRQVYKREAKF